MAHYRWSCLACGQPNDASIEQCIQCACPESATAKQVDHAREAFVRRGGVLQGDPAIIAEADLSAWEVFGSILLILLGGGWRYQRKGNR